MGVFGVACLVALDVRRAPRGRADPAARAVQEPRLRGHAARSAFVVGFALFGALTFLPLFQQTVRGLSPTASGLQLLPVMGGLLITSIVSGPGDRAHRALQGRSRSSAPRSPRSGMCLLSSLDETTSTGVAAFHMLSSASGSGWSCRCSCSWSRTRCPTTCSASRRPARPCSARSAARSAPRSSARSSPAGWRRPEVDRLRGDGRRVARAFTDSLHVVFLVAAASWPSRSRCLLADPRERRCARPSSHRRRRRARRPGRHRLAARAHARAQPRRRPRPDAGVHGAASSSAQASTSPPAPLGAAAARRAGGADGRRTGARSPHVRTDRPRVADGRVARRRPRRGRPRRRRRARRCASGSSSPAPRACAS